MPFPAKFPEYVVPKENDIYKHHINKTMHHVSIKWSIIIFLKQHDRKIEVLTLATSLSVSGSITKEIYVD